MKIKYYPVLIFVYDRPKLLLNLLESIKKNKNYNRHKYYFFCDIPKKTLFNFDIKKTKKNIRFINNFRCNKKIIKLRKKNYGLAKNVISGVSSVLKHNEACIVLEDDLVLHEDCLNFINFGLNKFKHDKKIGSISGYSYINNYNLSKHQNWFKLYRHCSWSWGTWKRTWKNLKWDYSKLFLETLNFQSTHKKYLKAGRDIPQFLDAQINKLINSWAVRFNFNCLEKGLLSIGPIYSLTKNDGFGINATHTINFLNKKKIIFNELNKINLKFLKKPKLNKKFNDIIRNQHGLNRKLFLKLIILKFFNFFF